MEVVEKSERCGGVRFKTNRRKPFSSEKLNVVRRSPTTSTELDVDFVAPRYVQHNESLLKTRVPTGTHLPRRMAQLDAKANQTQGYWSEVLAVP